MSRWTGISSGCRVWTLSMDGGFEPGYVWTPMKRDSGSYISLSLVATTVAKRQVRL